MARRADTRLPYSALCEYLGTRSPSQIARKTKMPERTVLRWQKAGGIPWYIASEKLCAKLGVHPTEIWGNEWYEITARLDEPAGT